MIHAPQPDGVDRPPAPGPAQVAAAVRPTSPEDLLHHLAPQVLGALTRRWGQFDACEDAVQEAMLVAIRQWPDGGAPANPYGWLITVATRRLIDAMRADVARRRREDIDHGHRTPAPDFDPVGEMVTGLGAGGSEASVLGDLDASGRDDILTLLFLCCHPALPSASQIALTLRAVGGLTTAEISRAFLVPEATMAQRIVRAKARIRESGARFTLPPARQRDKRVATVLAVLYLIFNEGYTATGGRDLARSDLTAEAIRLVRLMRAQLPEDGEVTGLLALMLLTEARRPARTRPDGSLVPLAEQDRSRWRRDLIDEGVALITDSLAHTRLGPYQLQAAVAAVHDEAERGEDTDWIEINALYGLLETLAPNPMVSLNRAVAIAMVEGPRAGLARVESLEADGHLAHHHRLHAVRAHLLEEAGDPVAAQASYVTAARLATNIPERRYLQGRAAHLSDRKAPGYSVDSGDELAREKERGP